MTLIRRVNVRRIMLVTVVHLHDDPEEHAQCWQLCHLLTLTPIISAEH